MRTTFLTLIALFSFTLIFAQNKSVKTIKVFPNPATNVVSVLGLKNTEKAEIRILNSYGTVVLKHHWRIKNKAVNIPIPSLESGIYMILIKSEEQDIQTKFFKK